MPVHHIPESLSRLFPPSNLIISQVDNAPTGAAKLKMTKCPRAARFDKPCLKRTEVRPNAAGALWIMMAKKIINPSFVLDVADEAPMAMPSAAACITKPIVVARVLVCFGVGVSEPRKPSSSSTDGLSTMFPPKLSKLKCWG